MPLTQSGNHPKNWHLQFSLCSRAPLWAAGWGFGSIIATGQWHSLPPPLWLHCPVELLRVPAAPRIEPEDQWTRRETANEVFPQVGNPGAGNLCRTLGREGKGTTLVHGETTWEVEGCEDQCLTLCWLLPGTTSHQPSSPHGPKLLYWAFSKPNWMAIGSDSAALFPLNQCWSCQAPHSRTYHRRC